MLTWYQEVWITYDRFVVVSIVGVSLGFFPKSLFVFPCSYCFFSPTLSYGHFMYHFSLFEISSRKKAQYKSINPDTTKLAKIFNSRRPCTTCIFHKSKKGLPFFNILIFYFNQPFYAKEWSLYSDCTYSFLCHN